MSGLHQRSQLAQLLCYSGATVPFHKARLAAICKSDGEIACVQVDPQAVVSAAYAEDTFRTRIRKDEKIAFLRLAAIALAAGRKLIQHKSDVYARSAASGGESNG